MTGPVFGENVKICLKKRIRLRFFLQIRFFNQKKNFFREKIFFSSVSGDFGTFIKKNFLKKIGPPGSLPAAWPLEAETGILTHFATLNRS